MSDIPKGYKQTEVGILPEDWEVIPLSKGLSAKPGYGINAPAVLCSDRLPAYIRITDITEDGWYDSSNPVSVKSADADNYFLEDGDILFARTGASVGKSYMYRLSDGQLVFAGFLIRIHPDSINLHAPYVAAYITTGPYWRWVQLMSMRSGQPGINGKEYARLPIPKPPLPEQRAIATALSDVDALLAGLDRLITKKRDLKQAAMQALLSPPATSAMDNGELKMESEGSSNNSQFSTLNSPLNIRLPGFGGEWEVKQAAMQAL
ncbi:MAG: restriction endonuclease subunit S, partial [Kiritimatiellia bacterium]